MPDLGVIFFLKKPFLCESKDNFSGFCLSLNGLMWKWPLCSSDLRRLGSTASLLKLYLQGPVSEIVSLSLQFRFAW